MFDIVENVYFSARQFALGAIKSQMESFNRWGVIGDWDNPYYTFDPQYESKQLDVFMDMYEKVNTSLVYVIYLKEFVGQFLKHCLSYMGVSVPGA